MPGTPYDAAVGALFQAPVEHFVAERKRLAAELKAAGDKEAAARFAKLARPPISAWTVDQLWWHERPAFDALFETAQRLRDGKLDAMAAHREAIAKLRAHAVTILSEAGHGATEATLRKVTQTLAALAAAGNWDPDPPGALAADRDPPGFEAIGISSAAPAEDEDAAAGAHGATAHGAKPHDAKPHGATAHDAKPHDAKAHDAKAHAANHDAKAHDAKAAADAERHRAEAAEARRRAEREAAAARAEAAAAARRAEAERARAAAERHRLEAALRTAHGDVAQREREVAKLERELAAAHAHVTQAKAIVDDLEHRLAQLAP